MTGDLSPHFSRREFACHCGLCGLSLPSPVLVAGLEELRAFLGLPVRVLSGLRCAARNAAVGGATDSQHLTGYAADIRADVPLTALFRAAVGVPVFFAGGVGIYPDGGFVHVDVRTTRARWGHLSGRYCSFLEAWDALKAREGTA